MLNYLDAYRIAATIRAVELEIVGRYHPDPGDPSRSPMRCPVHLSIGQETIAAAVRLAVGDITSEFPPLIYSNHRAHAHYIAAGGDLRAMIAELYGKATGCARGWGGSMHLIDESVGFMGTSAIVGSALSIATGAAFGMRLAKKPNVTVAYIGDSAVESGQYYEALNFATLHKLALLIVEEDNGLSTATGPQQRQPATRLITPQQTTHDKVFESMYIALERAARHVQAGNGPHHIRIKTHRYFEHVGVGRDDWRVQRELDRPGDPVRDLRLLCKRDDADEIDYQIEKTVDDAFTFAEESPWATV